MAPLDNILQSVLNRVTPTSPLDEIEKAVGIAKTAAEVSKTEIDTRNANAVTRQESLKAWSSILVPVVSLLALVFTIGVQAIQLESSRQQQSQQLDATRQQNEDTQWRSFLDSIREETKDTPNRIISDVTFAPRLKTFLHSKLYGAQAVDVAKRMVGSIVDEGGFSDLIGVAYGDLNSVPLSDLIDISKSLNRLQQDAGNQCGILSKGLQLPATAGGNFCNGNLSDDEAKSLVDGLADKQNGTALLSRKQTTNTIASEQSLVSYMIAIIVRSAKSNDKISLNGAVIALVDLSKVDFGNFDLTNTILDRVDLYGSKLTPRQFAGFAPWGSNWWDAGEINQDLLQNLLSNYFPGYFSGEMIRSHGNFDRKYYTQRINELCKPKLAACAESELNFNSANFAVGKF